MPVATKTKPAWQFLWIYEDDYFRESHSDRRGWKERIYRAATLEEACDKMVRWIDSRLKNVYVDYEAKAEHVTYNPKRHEETFPNLTHLEHPIREHIA